LPQSQGGGFPFSQTTVVPFCGTTTVVFFAGGGHCEFDAVHANRGRSRMRLSSRSYSDLRSVVTNAAASVCNMVADEE
jgi:hypothetical protein